MIIINSSNKVPPESGFTRCLTAYKNNKWLNRKEFEQTAKERGKERQQAAQMNDWNSKTAADSERMAAPTSCVWLGLGYTITVVKDGERMWLRSAEK